VTVATHKFLEAVADCFNPLLAVVAIAAPFLRKPRALRLTISYYLSAFAAIGFVYLVRAIDADQLIWASGGLDFSTHSAFAASLAVSIGALHRRWVAPLALAVVLYFALELIMRYHGVLDILTSASLAALTALLVHLAAARMNKSAG
jgi:hypothetical protein